jgi:hypothetical protein
MAKRGILTVLFAMFMMVLMAGNVYAGNCGGGTCDPNGGGCGDTCESKLGNCGGGCGGCNDTCETKAVKDWTILVFLNADNNLDSFGVKDVNEMEKIGSTDNMNIVVLLDREGGVAKKLFVTKDNDENNITSKVVEELGVYDMGSYKNLVDFVAWGVKNYPAKNYMVDIWNHGSGWNKKRSLTLKGISYDDQSGNHITTAQLGEAMASIYQLLGKKLDILAMDACLMQMAEVCYEIKDYVQFSVASEETEPGDGYTYDDFLGPLAKNPSMDATAFAKLTAQAYTNHYKAQNEACTQSAVDLTKMDVFVAKFDQLCAKLAEQMSDKAVVTAIKKQVLPGLQSFYYRTNKDLGHFLTLVQKNVKNAEVQTLVAETLALYAAGQTPLVSGNYINGDTMKNATGLAIYFPSYAPGSDYSKVKFSKTNWTLFLTKYFAAAASVQ